MGPREGRRSRMTNKNEQPSIKVEPRPAGGKRNGFLAEEKHLDRRGLLRLGTWGIVAVAAVAIAVLVNESSMRLRRDEVAAVDLARQSQQIQALAKESQNQTRRLAAAIDTLNNDRDRLFARVTVLEEGLDSVTGSITKQGSSKTSARSSDLPTAAAMLAPPAPAPFSLQPTAQDRAASPTLAPVAAAVATEAPKSAAPEKPAAADAKAAEPLRSKTVATETPKPASAPQMVASSASPSSQPASTSAELNESKSMIGPPAPPAQKPTEQATIAAKAASTPVPLLVASAAPDEKEKKTSDTVEPISAIAVNRTEFGIDLGGANSVPGLRGLWRGLLKIRANAPLQALQPIMVIREGNNGLGMQLRLVAGPFNDAAAAARVCAGLVEHQRPCETTVYDGQRLTLKPGDEPAVAAIAPARSEPVKFERAKLEPEKAEAQKSEAEKLAAEKALRRYPHRRFYARRLPPSSPPPASEPPAAAQEPPKPEPSTFSSFFTRHAQPQPPPPVNGS